MKEGINWDQFLFPCHSYGNLNLGLPKGLTKKQQEQVAAFEKREADAEAGMDKPLTDNMRDQLGRLRIKDKESKKITLSDGAKTYLKKLYRQFGWGRKDDIFAYILEKGIRAEERSISLYTEVTGNLYMKNEERRKNDWVAGTCDNNQGIIRDMKTSWTWETFPLLDEDAEISNSIYVDQLMAYMNLWEMDKAELVYCLVDTPFDIIDAKMRQADYNVGLLDANGSVREDRIDAVVELVEKHIYEARPKKANGSDYLDRGLWAYVNLNTNLKLEWFADFQEIPKEERVKTLPLTFDHKRWDRSTQVILEAREYLKSLNKK